MNRIVLSVIAIFALAVMARQPAYAQGPPFSFGVYGYRQPRSAGAGNMNELLRNKAIPVGVRDALHSLVSVRVYRPNVLLPGRLVFVGGGAGFVADDHLVLTKFHIVASAVVNDYYFDNRNTMVTVGIGDSEYETEFDAADPGEDLLLLRVVDGDRGQSLRFNAKPLVLSYLSLDEITPFDRRDVSRGVIYRDPFFSFGLPRLSENPSDDVFFPKRWTADEFYGYFVGSGVATNGNNRFGLLGGNLEQGFSGSPILDRFGRVIGTHGWGTGTSATFTPSDKIINFLARAHREELEKQGHEQGATIKKGD